MWEQIAANRRKSTLLVITAALLLAALGWAGGEYFLGQGGGTGGVLLALVVWLVMTLAAWFQGDSIMLSVAGAHRVQKADFPQLFNIVEEMTLAAGLSKMPAVYVIDDPAPNAFATGRRAENAAVAVTSGLLRTLDRDELQGVVAHEMAHVRNRDIQLMLFAGVLAGAIVILAETGLRGMWLGGGRSRSRREGGGDSSGLVAIFAMLLMILAPISRSSSTSPSRASASTWPTPRPPRSRATRKGWPRRWRRSAGRRSAWAGPPRPRRPCTSSTRSSARGRRRPTPPARIRPSTSACASCVRWPARGWPSTSAASAP
jgi:Zn-dependent protease with chaperone function